MQRTSRGAMLIATLALATIIAGPDASAASSRHRAHAGLHHHHHHVRRPHVGHDHSVTPPAPHHPRVVTFVDGYEQPPIPSPYPFDGKLAGDGILRTGILDSNALRAFGIVRN